MTDTTNASPTQVIRQRLCDDDALLHGQSNGSISCAHQARTALNRVACEQLRHGIPQRTPTSVGVDVSQSDMPATDSIVPNGESVSLPVPAADLEAAATRLRPDPALTKALKRLLQGDWTARTDDDTGELVITFDPRSKGKGKKRPSSYTTKHDSCTCPGAIIRGGCYHPLAWQIVNEAIFPTTSIQASLPSAMFVLLCRLALASGADHVILTADSGRGTLTLGAPDVAVGTIWIDLATPVLLTLEQQLRATDLRRVIDALVGALRPEGDQLMLDLSDGSLLIVAGAEDAPVYVDGLDTQPLTRLPQH